MSINEFLRSRQIPFETLLHHPARSAAKLAQSVHLPGKMVAKPVLLKAGSQYVLAVLPATHRVDFERLGMVLGAGELRLASEDEVEQVFTDCERGAVPPFGHLYGLRTVIDASLAGGTEIVFEANLRHEGVRMRFRDYEATELPMHARFATEIAPRQRRASHGAQG
ncbi:MAG TPA: YbaK/EbsC family protein [Isosphaeraceae bacterium]|jgi:Ala-tRNA(Pro) deacylase|nr:YbaK/EbsC family protein [Isosphaeraceae bacterium]